MHHVVTQKRTVAEKLEILADAAKYDVSCTSSGVSRKARAGDLGSSSSAGCCHSFTPDGRCISLLKVLMTNVCIYDCAYCINRSSNQQIERTAFTPRELADLTIAFYRRNYIEGLFLSSGVIGSPDHTTELIIQTLRILRDEHRFRGYIHAKAIPGTSPELIEELGLLTDRLSVNMELPSQESLNLLAPDKSGQSLLAPMRQIAGRIAEDKESKASLPAFQMMRRKSGSLMPSTPLRDHAFVPAGQSTQMIIGATPETDYSILTLSGALYAKLNLKRVFFSAYVPVNRDRRLPDSDQVQLDREHRLFQADWLLRFYGFEVDEIIDAKHPMLDLLVDPKANWALNHLDDFPVEVNSADLEMLMRVPGIGALGARRIVAARRSHALGEDELRRLGIAFKRARYFVTCNGKWLGGGIEFSRETLRAQLAAVPDGGRHGRRDPRRIPGQMAFGDIDSSFNLSAGPAPLDATASRVITEASRVLENNQNLATARTVETPSHRTSAGKTGHKPADPLAGWCA